MFVRWVLIHVTIVVQFSVDAEPQTKICDGSATRTALDWQPKHKSFVEYMQRLGAAAKVEMSAAGNAVV